MEFPGVDNLIFKEQRINGVSVVNIFLQKIGKTPTN
jgi:hypothetical protein